MEVPKDALKARQADVPTIDCVCGHPSDRHSEDRCSACPCKLLIPEDPLTPMDARPAERDVGELWRELGLRGS